MKNRCGFLAATLGLADRVDAGKAARPDLVVWPGELLRHRPLHRPRRARGDRRRGPGGRGAAADGGGRRGPGDRRLAQPRDRLVRRAGSGRPTYDKIHPVPFGEYIPLRSAAGRREIPALAQIPSDMVPGHRTGVLRVGPARLGVLMCFEVAYDGLVHAVVRDGAGVIVVPTNNATYTGTGQVEQQFAMARLRAIETGRAVVVASTNGISGIIGPDGRVIARAPVRSAQVLEAPVPVRTGLTAGVRSARWVQPALARSSLVSLLRALLVGYRRRSPQGDAPAPEGPPQP